MKSFASVRKLWKQRPFKPFRIITDTGQRYDVPGPEYILVTTTTLVVGVGKDENDIFDSMRELGVLNVNAIEPLGASAETK